MLGTQLGGGAGCPRSCGALTGAAVPSPPWLPFPPTAAQTTPGPSQPCPTGPAKPGIVASGTFLWEAGRCHRSGEDGEGRRSQPVSLLPGPGPSIPTFSSRRGWLQQTCFTRVFGSLTLLSALCGCSGGPASPPLPVWTPVVSLALPNLGSAPSTAQVLPGGCFLEHAPGSEHQGLVASTPVLSSPEPPHSPSQGAPCFLGKEKVQVGPWTQLHLPQSGLWGQSHEHSWVGGSGCGPHGLVSHLRAPSCSWRPSPPHISVDPGSLHATVLPRSLPCPALPQPDLAEPISQPALRQSCSGHRGPGGQPGRTGPTSTGARSGAAERTGLGAAPVVSTGLAGSGSAWARQAPQLVCVLCSERVASGSWQAARSRAGTDHGASQVMVVTVTDPRQTRGTLSRSTPGSRV